MISATKSWKVGTTVLAIAISLLIAKSNEAAPCVEGGIRNGACVPVAARASGDHIDLTATQSSASRSGATVGEITAPPPRRKPSESSEVVREGNGRAVLRDSYGVTRAPKPAPANPEVTLTDLASFHPAPAVDHMEPNGWSIIGLDTNFYATTDNPTQTGTLLGRPASVRFTPVSFTWNYGDGSTRTTKTSGTTWANQHIIELDPTPTSHPFHTRGHYTITLTVDFAAEYSWNGNDWQTIDGTITLPANTLTTTTGSIKTALVAHDCIQDPHGTGC
jgi:hypothetical protein